MLYTVFHNSIVEITLLLIFLRLSQTIINQHKLSLEKILRPETRMSKGFVIPTLPSVSRPIPLYRLSQY